MSPKSATAAATAAAAAATATAATAATAAAAATTAAAVVPPLTAAGLANLAARVAANEARETAREAAHAAELGATTAQFTAAIAELRAEHKRTRDELEGNMGVLMAENADKSVLIDDLQDAQGIAEMSAAKNLLPGDIEFFGKRMQLAKDIFPMLRVAACALNKNVPDVRRAKRQLIKAYMLTNNLLAGAEYAKEAKGGKPFSFTEHYYSLARSNALREPPDDWVPDEALVKYVEHRKSAEKTVEAETAREAAAKPARTPFVPGGGGGGGHGRARNGFGRGGGAGGHQQQQQQQQQQQPGGKQIRFEEPEGKLFAGGGGGGRGGRFNGGGGRAN